MGELVHNSYLLQEMVRSSAGDSPPLFPLRSFLKEALVNGFEECPAIEFISNRRGQPANGTLLGEIPRAARVESTVLKKEIPARQPLVFATKTADVLWCAHLL